MAFPPSEAELDDFLSLPVVDERRGLMYDVLFPQAVFVAFVLTL